VVFSPDIRWLAATSLLGFLLLAIGQVRARHPVIQLRLLRDRQFGSVVMMAMIVGVALYGTAYVIRSSSPALPATTRCSRAGSCCSRACR
jgi:hypothetical protein